ncbi:MAG: exo-alpha-sialidase [Pirellulales bacterium]
MADHTARVTFLIWLAIFLAGPTSAPRPTAAADSDAASAAPPATTLSTELRARCLDVLRGGLASDAFWPAMHAAEALSDEGLGAEVRDRLWPRLPAEPDAQRRCGLAREIVRSGDRRALPALFAVLALDDSYGHTHAAESLYKIADVGDGVALRKLYASTPDPRRKLMAAASLARCGNMAALQFIRSQVTVESPESRKIAAWILARLGDPADVPALHTALDRETEPVTHAYQQHALAALQDAAGRKGLADNLADSNDEVRTYAHELVGHLGLADLKERLEQSLDDPFLDVRIRAAQSLLTLARPRRSPAPEFTVDVHQADAQRPRISEGAVAVLDDGRLLYATTEFQKSSSDFAAARIIGSESSDGGRTWSSPRVLQENDGRMNVMSASLVRPVVAQRDAHPLLMFYLQKNGVRDLHVFCRRSRDEGRTFEKPVRVTSEQGYHVMNNDRVVRLTTGRLLCPVAATPDVEKVNHFRSYCYWSDDHGQTWHKGHGQVDQPRRGAMEPEVMEREDGTVLMIVRTQLGHIAAASSSDGGDTWSAPQPWGVRSPEAPASLRRIPATGQWLLIWNDVYDPQAGHGGARRPLSYAVSDDEGRTWSPPRVLENDPNHSYAYTSITFHQDRMLATYYVSEDKADRLSSRFRSIPIAALQPTER